MFIALDAKPILGNAADTLLPPGVAALIIAPSRSKSIIILSKFSTLSTLSLNITRDLFFILLLKDTIIDSISASFILGRDSKLSTIPEHIGRYS